MVGSILFQPSLLDCWACRDFKRFRQLLKGGGAIVVHPAPSGEGAATTNSLSTSQPKSPGYSWGSAGNALTGLCSPSEVNRRDHLGRTVLHLISASTEPVSIDYLTVLLAHPSVNVNLQDHENGWTALHRALYHGNLLTALTLLKRSPPVDVRIKDFEGLTAFDLYNSTIHGTNPPHAEGQAGMLYTWGANRNYTLGVGTSDDRILPDRVHLRRADEEYEDASIPMARGPGSKFDRIQVKDVGMSKFATVVLTAEKSSNVWVCGIGNTGRIGRAPQTQPHLERLKDFTECASAIAVGPDHTCIVTSEGDLYTFGFNRFSQLGYALEHGFGLVSSTKSVGGAASTTFGGASIPNADLDIQISPRKVLGPLKREHILGAAAGKLHTAAFTSDSLYTWGTNTGQLGYDRSATPIQVVPRKVSLVTPSMSIVSIAVTDFATACLMSSGDVMLLHNDTSFFVRFPHLTFSSQVSVYRPRQARPKPSIERLVGGPNNSFAAISDIGDLWQFSPEHPSEYAQASGVSTAAKSAIKPQLIWSVRKNKKVGAARDVSLGTGSDMILVTESGHVFVRSRRADTPSNLAASATMATGFTSSSKGKSGWKPVPYLQRVFKVATNESGGLAAIKRDAEIRDVRVRGRTLNEDFHDILPHLRAHAGDYDDGSKGDVIVGTLADAAMPDMTNAEAVSDDLSDEGESDNSVPGSRYINMAQTIAEAARRWTDRQEQNPAERKHPPLGCDMFLVAGGRYLPAHRSIVSARLPSVAPLIQNPRHKSGGGLSGISVKNSGDYVVMSFTGASFATALFFLHYIYTDDLPAVWTASIGMRVEKLFSAVKMNPKQIQAQLIELADSLHLTALHAALTALVPSAPKPSLSIDFRSFFASHVDAPPEQSPFHDVLLQFRDRKVPAHSVALRRSPFFSALFQPHWTSSRWQKGIIEIDMAHIRWEVARIALLHLYTDELTDLFMHCDDDRNQDEYIDFVIEVLAFSNELLLDKLKLVCCSLLRPRVLPNNVSALISDTDFYHVLSFKESLMDYASRTMETLLEAGMLDHLENRMIKDLTRHVRNKQDERLHRTWAEEYLSGLIVKHQEFYFDLDIPPPSLGIAAARVPKRPPRSSDRRLSPLVGAQKGLPIAVNEPTRPAFDSPDLRPTGTSTPTNAVSTNQNNDGSMMFSMDDDLDEELRIRKQRPSDGGADPDFALPPAASKSSSTSSTPWKAQSIEKAKASIGDASAESCSIRQDLRSIMAAEQSKSRSPFSAPSTAVRPAISKGTSTSTPSSMVMTPNNPPVPVRMSQKDRKRQQGQQTGLSSSPSPAPTMPVWKSVDQSVTTRPSTSPNTPQRSTSAQASPSVQGTPASAPRNANVMMGPTITPTRMRPTNQRRTTLGVNESEAAQAWSMSGPVAFPSLGSSPSGRRDGPAWATSSSPIPQSPPLAAVGSEQNVPSKASVAVANPTVTPGAPMSFAEIQAEELRRYEELSALQHARAPRSFAELQEEDRRESEQRRLEEQRAREFEEEFEKESKRIQAEQRQQKTRQTNRRKDTNSSMSKKATGSDKGNKGGRASGDTEHPPDAGTTATKRGGRRGTGRGGGRRHDNSRTTPTSGK